MLDMFNLTVPQYEDLLDSAYWVIIGTERDEMPSHIKKKRVKAQKKKKRETRKKKKKEPR